MSRHQIGNIISVAYSAIRFSILRLVSGGRIKTTLIERVSPNVVVDIDRKSKLSMGSKVRIHSGSRITAAKGGIVEIGDSVRINNNCRIACRDHIVIENGVEFGPGVLVYDHDHDFRAEGGIKSGKYKKSPVIIKKNVWIGANTIILRGTEIGKNCVIGAGSVINGKYPDNVVVVQKRVTDVLGDNQV